MKPLILLMFSLLALAHVASLTPSKAQAAPLNNSELLALTYAQQEIWIKGAFDALGHLAYQSDKSRAACIWQWLEENSKARKEFLIEHFRRHPNQNPTSTILILLKNDCRLSV